MISPEVARPALALPYPDTAKCCTMAGMRPAEKWTVKQAATAIGVEPATWRAYVARNQAPEPDGHSNPCGCPWWFKSTVMTWHQSRPRAA